MATDDVIVDEDCNALGVSIFKGASFDVLGEMINGENDVAFSGGGRG
jgi:hypothetical protein